MGAKIGTQNIQEDLRSDAFLLVLVAVKELLRGLVGASWLRGSSGHDGKGGKSAS